MRDALAAVGLPIDPPVAAPEGEVRRLGAARLAGAVAFAAGVDPALEGNGAGVAAARRVVAGVGLGAGLAASELALALRVGRPQVGRLAARDIPDALARAACARLTFEERVRGERAS